MDYPPDNAVPPRSCLTFVHFSDPHLTRLHGVEPRELLNKRLAGYLSWHSHRRHRHSGGILTALRRDLPTLEPHHIVLSGDLTNLGTPAECREAAAWLAELGAPERITVVPGNHDTYVPAQWGSTLGHWRPYMSGDGDADATTAAGFPFQRQRGPVAFIALNTAYPSRPFLATGRLGNQQLDGLARQLSDTASGNTCRILIMHHPPQGDAVRRRKRLVDAAAFQEVIASHGAELILHGHTHRALQGEIAGPHGPVPTIGVAAASAHHKNSARTAAYHGYTLERRSHGWRLGLTVRAYDPVTECFTALSCREVSLPSAD